MKCQVWCVPVSSLVSAVVLGACTAAANSGNWLGTQSALWTNSANWSAAPYPSGTQNATFNGSGSGYTTIDLTGFANGVSNIIFDTTNVAAYTIGNFGVNQQALALVNNGAVQITSSCNSNQTLNAQVLLGLDRSANFYTFRNDKSSVTLTFAGGVTTTNSGGTAGGKVLNIAGVGPVTISGDMTLGGATSLTVTNATTGLLTLSGTNRISTLVLAGAEVMVTGTNRIDAVRVNCDRAVTFTGTNTISALYLSGTVALPALVNIAGGGSLCITNSGGDGFYATQDATINGPGTLEMQGGIATDKTSNNYVAFGKTITINAQVTGASEALELWSPTGISGTYVLNGINDFTGNVTMGPVCTLSVAKIGNKGSTTSNLGRGTTVTISASGSRLLYTGVGETADRTFAVNNNVSIENSGSGHLNLSGQINVSSGSKTLTLQGSTLGTAEFSGLLRNDLGILSLAKSGTGTWLLTTNHTYTGTTTVNSGVLALTGANGTLLSSTGFILVGGTLLLDNTEAVNNTNRLRDASAVTLAGGTLRFSNTGGATNYSENVGAVAVSSGSSTIATVPAALGQTATLRLAALTHPGAGTVTFTGAGLGQSDRNRIFIAGQPDGLIGPWATVDGSKFAAYSSAAGVYATDAAVFTDIAARGPSTIVSNGNSNVRINSAGVSGPIELGSDTTRIALLLQNTTTPAEINTASKTLQTGGIVIPENHASVMVGQAPGDGTLSSAQANGELVLNNNGANALTVNAVVANNGASTRLSKVGSGSVTLAVANTFSGVTAASGGPLVLAHSNALQNSTLSTGGTAFDSSVSGHAFTVGNLGGAFDLALADNAAVPNPVALTVGSNNANSVHTGVIRDNGALTKRGAGALTLSGANTFGGGLAVVQGTVVASNVNALGIGGVTSAGTLNLTANGSDVTYSGLSVSLSGAGTNNVWLATGGSTTRFTGDYAGFTGVWNIGIGAAAGAAKVLMSGADNAAAKVNVLSNGTLYCSAGTHNAALTLGGGDTGESYGQLRLDNNVVWSGPVTLTAPMTSAADGYLGASSGQGLISGAIGDNGAGYTVDKVGAGTVYLLGNNTYAGPTWIKYGTLRVDTLGSVGGGASPLGNPATPAQGAIKLGLLSTNGVLLYTGQGETSDRVIELAGTTGGGTIDHTGTNLLKLTSDVTVSGLGVKSLTLQGSTIGSGELAGLISDGGPGRTNAIVKNGTGTWTLSGANSFSGGTTVNGGKLVAADRKALGANGLLTLANANTSTLAFDNDGGADENVCPVTMAAGAVATIASGRATPGEGISHRLGALGLSTVTLNITNGANVTSGTPSITADSLSLSAGGAGATVLVPTTANISIGTVAILSNGSNAKSAQLDGTSSGNAITGPISNGLNTVSLTKSNGSTWTLFGSNWFTGATAVNGGRLVVAGPDGRIAGTSGLTFSGNGVLELRNSEQANVTDRLRDAAGLTMNGGALRFVHSGGLTSYSEKLGALTVSGGSNSLFTSRADVGYTSVVTIASLARTSPGLLDFQGEGLGADDRNRVIFAAPPAEGLIGLWATYNATNFAAYSNAVGVVVAGDGLFTDIPAKGPYTIADDSALNARIASEGVDGPLTLAGATTSRLKSLLQDSTFESVIAMTNQTLQVSDVMVGADRQPLTLGTAENEGLLMPAAAGGTLSLINRSGSALTVNAGVTNNSSASSVVKYGTGTVKLAGRASYTGSTVISDGALEFGGPSASRLSGVISGAGTLVKSGTNQLHLLAANTFTGPFYVNSGIVRPDQNTAFGTTAAGVFIASGATLDLGCDSSVGGTRGNEGLTLNLEEFTVAGAGADGGGAIVNNGGQTQMNAMNRVYLSDDTTFGGKTRWDIRNNSPFLYFNDHTLTKTGVNEIAIIAPVYPGAGHMVVNQGLVRWESGAVINGTSNNTITVNNGAILELYNLSPSIPAWRLVINDGSYFRGSTASTTATNINIWGGPVTLNGRAFLNGNANNVNWTIGGDISGAGSLIKAGNGSAILWLVNSNNTYSGTTIVSNGTLFAKYAGSLPGYDSGKVTVAGGGTLAIPTGDGVNGWSGAQISDLYAQSTFTNNGSTFAGLSIDTSLAGADYSGELAKTLSLTKNGTNSLTLGGLNTSGGNLTVNGGELVINGSGNRRWGALTVGNATLVMTNAQASYTYVTNNSAYIGNGSADFGKMVLGGNTVWASYLAPDNVSGPVLFVGNSGRGVLVIQDNAVLSNRIYLANNVGSAGAVYQRGNSFVHNWCGRNSDGRFAENGYGYYELSSGTMTNNGYFQLGRNLTGVGVFAQYGGRLQQGNLFQGDFTISRGGTGTVYLAGGTYVSSTGMTIGGLSDNGGSRGYAELTLDHAADAYLNGSVNVADRTNMFATVNLNGGILTANSFSKGNRFNSVALLNFNGGTFRARTAGNLFGSGVNTLDAVYVYPGGATVDATNLAVTLNANLRAPTGNGVASISVAPRGGYIGPPFVIISGGGGVGATAVAQFDSETGYVTGVTITSPGCDYTSAPTVTLVGGGTNIQTAVTGVTLAPNASGGLTKQGAGTLTLNGTNTYGGATTLLAGTLKLSHALAAPAATTFTFAGGTLDLNGLTLTNELNATGAIAGGITNGTLQTVFSPAGEYTIGSQSYALNVRASGALRGAYLVDVDEVGGSDLLAVQGNIDLSNLALQIVDPTRLDIRRQYTILTCTGTRTGAFSSNNLPNSRWRIFYRADGSVKLINVSGTVMSLR